MQHAITILTIRRPNGQIETATKDGHLADSALPATNKRMAELGKGQIIKVERKMQTILRQPVKVGVGDPCPRCHTYCDGDCRSR